MAEKKNMFEQAAVKRQQEQKTIEAAVLGKPAQKDTWRARKRGDDATSITLSISREDKERVNVLAEKRGLSISDLLHFWIQEAYEAQQE